MTKDPEKQAVEFVEIFIADKYRRSGNPIAPAVEVHLVWFCKVLQNWKALVTSNIAGGSYFEVTFNGDKLEIYIDEYRKVENTCIQVSR